MSSSFFSSLKRKILASDSVQRTLQAVNVGESVVWNGCVGSSAALLGSTLSEHTNRTILVVVSKVALVERAASDWKLFTDAPVLTFPLLSTSSLDNSDEIFLSEDADFGTRLSVLKALDKRASSIKTADASSDESTCGQSERAPVVIASLAALTQPVPSIDQVVDDTISLKVGDEYGLDNLLQWLSEGAFHATTSVELPGEYSARGHIVDIYAVDWDYPIRIEFFGDAIESIRSFDIADQRSLEQKENTDISRLRTRTAAEGRFVDRLPEDSLILFYETDQIIGETTRLISERQHGDTKGFAVSDIVNELYRRPTVHAVSVASGTELASVSIDVNFYSVARLQGDLTHVENALNEIDGEQIDIICASEAEIRRLEETFALTKPSREGRIAYELGALAEGFEWREGKRLLIGSDQLFGRSISRRSKTVQTKKLSKTVDSFLELTSGDLVIHVERGLARFVGIETIKKANQLEDHLKLEFANKTFLYVPASKIGKIQRYIGSGKTIPKLASLKGTAWSKQKKDVQEAICELAAEMIELQAKREAWEGLAFPEDGPWQRDFESMFPYRETDDQLTAIEAIKKDMERTRPMDRLLCGDVGFGKTEVALRAAFKAVEAGFQVAMLAPTTVLVEQHYRTFSDRVAPFPIRVASLSRYSSKANQAATIEKLKSGEIDIVIGTHRIIQKDVQFKKLGLVIIDEEQKFGVRHKEQLKKFKSMVDVLTLTATPIPRTLHFSLIGIRDVSNLSTPPADRLPVETRVLRFNQDIVRNAVLRELNRGGQIYYLHNRVFDIEEKAAQLRRIAPEARIRVGHAQMSSAELESTMRDFVLKRFDMLVCTTIVESGLDIPNANTIFIDQSNRFGLAELHQLRGRVGREKRQAYCYLMLDANQTLSQDAAKRLHALEEYDKLGSGFQIAMKDLEIRGAGNILGTRQSGHIATIGYEMYCEFLEDAIRVLKKQPQKLRVDVEIDLPVSALLSDEYIPDSRAKIGFYRRLDRVTKIEEIVELRNELTDRFGVLTPEAERLFVLAQIRLSAFEYRVKTVQMEQFEGLLSSCSKMLAITFRVQSLMYKLRSRLEKRNVSMRLVESEQGIFKGYIDIPKVFFDSKGNVYEDEILAYALRLFSVKDYAKSDAERFSEQRLEMTEDETNADNTKPQSSAPPLSSALKRVKQNKKS
ncbi:MAG: transcription-repair coupling factor [Thermoguttaceae bacterium]|nr:transcription-repair coupling factor [Thermoguttaceae bacterium]